MAPTRDYVAKTGWDPLRREETNISSNLSRIVLTDKLQVMIFMTMTLGLRIGYLLIKSQKKKVNLELTKRAFFYKGLPFLMIVCSFVHKEATFLH